MAKKNWQKTVIWPVMVFFASFLATDQATVNIFQNALEFSGQKKVRTTLKWS